VAENSLVYGRYITGYSVATLKPHDKVVLGHDDSAEISAAIGLGVHDGSTGKPPRSAREVISEVTKMAAL
jgi:hypothetical protein